MSIPAPGFSSRSSRVLISNKLTVFGEFGKSFGNGDRPQTHRFKPPQTLVQLAWLTSCVLGCGEKCFHPTKQHL
jgi:hypothetical protein